MCTGKPVSVNDLASLVREVLGKNLQVVHVEPRVGDVLHSYGDPAKAKNVLGFEARTGFEKGLAEYVKSKSELP